MNDPVPADSGPTQDADHASSIDRSHARWERNRFALVVLGTLVRSCGRLHWTCELTTHFTVQAMLLALVVAGWLFYRRRRVLAGLCLAMAIWNGWEFFVSYAPIIEDYGAVNPQATLQVVSANVYSRNRDAPALKTWLDQVQPDVVFISEVDPWWAAQIETWKDSWPHQILRPRGDNFGLALICKYPINESEVKFLEIEIPAVSARITSQGRIWSVVGLHTLPPGGGRTAIRNRQLDAAAAWIKSLPAPRIVVGDLNAAPASPDFKEFLRDAGLRDSRQGFGWQASWPTSNPLVRIPIDHCLVDSKCLVMERTVGPKVGSDHYPIRIRIARP